MISLRKPLKVLLYHLSGSHNESFQCDELQPDAAPGVQDVALGRKQPGQGGRNTLQAGGLHLRYLVIGGQ